MAAPHVAGAVALLLDKNPNLTHSQLLAALTAQARPAPAGASLDDSLGWGVGKLDIKAAIDPVSAGGGSPSGPHAPFYQPSQPAPDGEARQLLDRFKRSLRGNEYLEFFHTYFREVRTLINRNKRVATVWHRCKGPLWLRTAIQAAGNPSMVLPDAIEQISLVSAIENMRQMLQRYGSRQLAADLDLYAAALRRIEGGQSLTQLVERIAEPETAPIL